MNHAAGRSAAVIPAARLCAVWRMYLVKVYLYYDASHVHSYDENGIDVIELLPGTHDEVRAFKYL